MRHGWGALAFNIFINDLGEGKKQPTDYPQSDAELGVVACTKGGASKRTRQEILVSSEKAKGK